MNGRLEARRCVQRPTLRSVLSVCTQSENAALQFVMFIFAYVNRFPDWLTRALQGCKWIKRALWHLKVGFSPGHFGVGNVKNSKIEGWSGHSFDYLCITP